MPALRPIPFAACRDALVWAAEQTGWNGDLLIDTAAEKLMHFQATDEALEHARAYLRPVLAEIKREVA